MREICYNLPLESEEAIGNIAMFAELARVGCPAAQRRARQSEESLVVG